MLQRSLKQKIHSSAKHEDPFIPHLCQSVTKHGWFSAADLEDLLCQRQRNRRTMYSSYWLTKTLTPIQAQALWSVPYLNTNVRTYGARVLDSPKAAVNGGENEEQSCSLSDRILKAFADLKVPHSWFTCFYIWSSLCSSVWGYQLYTRGLLFQYIAKHTEYTGKPSMSFNQIVLVWALFQFQGLRRMYESFISSKPSESKMHIGIFIIGMLYYTAMNPTIWIEGLRRLALSNSIGVR